MHDRLGMMNSSRKRSLFSKLVLGLSLLVFLSACSGNSVESTGSDEAISESTVPTVAPTTVEAEAVAPTTVVPTTLPTDDSPDEPAVDEPVEGPEPVLYADDFGDSILPIFENRCASCHNAGGPGAVHWALENADDIGGDSQILNAVVSAGSMPPWPAGGESPAFHRDRSLRADEIQALADWAASGAVVDVPGDTPVIADANDLQLDNVSMSLEPQNPYDGSPALADDYRCLIYDPQITEPTWLKSYNFVPDQTEVVHHAIGYLAPENTRDEAEALAAAEQGGGYECFGGSRLSDDLTFIAWAPGQNPTEYPENTGLMLQPGDFMVLQLHYHFDIDAPADSSMLELDLEPAASTGDMTGIDIFEYVGPAEIPCTTEETGPLCDRDAALAAGYERFGPEGVLAPFINGLCGASPEDFADMTSGIASSSCDWPVRSVGEIVSVFGHEHEIGSSFKLTLNPDTPEEKVLLDIPEWDFDWQYNYDPVETIVLERGDVIRVECSWDRSLRDPDLEPSYILWADGTNDEMCYSSIITKRP